MEPGHFSYYSEQAPGCTAGESRFILREVYRCPVVYSLEYSSGACTSSREGNR
jgi:hypothetical protein